MENIFEKASKFKLRFSTVKGLFSVEDLWDLQLTDLDFMARMVNNQLKEETEESFIGRKSKAVGELTLKLDILKSVIAVKLEDVQKAKARAERKSQADFLETLLQKKRLDKLENLSVTAIEKQLAALKEDSE